MRKRILIIGTTVLLGGLLAMAAVAQNRAQRGPGAVAPNAPAAIQEIITLNGTVAGMSLTAGQGMPAITLNTGAGDVTVMVGPYRQLMADKFEIRLGQALEIKAFQDPRIPGTYAATEIKDLATGAVVVLAKGNRAGGGMGMMRGGPGMMGNGPRMGGGGGMRAMRGMGQCLQLQGNLNEADRKVLDGTVVSTILEPGRGSSSFVLAVGSGNVTVYACPLRLLLQAGFVINAGDHMSVTADPIPNQAGSYVAAELNNLTTQKTLKLR